MESCFRAYSPLSPGGEIPSGMQTTSWRVFIRAITSVSDNRPSILFLSNSKRLCPYTCRPLSKGGRLFY